MTPTPSTAEPADVEQRAGERGMNMREKIARTLCRQNGLCVGFCHAQRCFEANFQYGEAADAVLEALREPDEAMERAFYETLAKTGTVTCSSAAEVWQAMLSAAGGER